MTGFRSENVGRGHEACDPSWIAHCTEDPVEESAIETVEQDPQKGSCSNASQRSDGAHSSSLERDATGTTTGGVPPSIPQELHKWCAHTRAHTLDQLTGIGEHSLRVDLLRVVYAIERTLDQ